MKSTANHNNPEKPIALLQGWGEHTLAADRITGITVGGRRLRVEHSDSHWLLAPIDDGVAWHDPPNAEAGEQGFALPDNTRMIRLLPRTPPRPVVFRIEPELTLFARSQWTLYAPVPLWLGVECESQGEWFDLASFPLHDRPDTWFGDPLSGILCVAAARPPWLKTDRIPSSETEAICPVTIRSQHDDAMPVPRLCVDSEHLAIYQGPRGFWTNRMEIEIIADQPAPRGRFRQDRPPEAGPEATLMNPARKTGHTPLLERILRIG